MKIINLQVQNIKKLTAIDITPKDSLVQITGKNGAGKTSILDSIWWALEGAKNIQVTPINKNATSARIRIDLGELVVTRTFTSKGDGFTTKITVTNADGEKIPGGGQKILDGFLGALSFDPLAFTRMKPRDQFDALRKFVPDVDFDEIERLNQEDYATRTEVNRKGKEASAAATQLPDRLDEGEVYINQSHLIQQMEDAGKHNADIEIRKNNRATMTARMNTCIGEANQLMKEAKEIKDKLDNAGKLKELVDISDIRRKIEGSKVVAKKMQDIQQRDLLVKTFNECTKESEEITKAMQAREDKKQKAIAEAKLPVEGITFGDGAILLNRVPFEQASDAEQLRAGLSIAMANNPKLRVIRIREGSLLDEDSENIIRDQAKKLDFQVWQEKVDSSGKVGFVIENGKLKQNEEDW